MEESKRQVVQEAQMAKVSQDTITKQLAEAQQSVQALVQLTQSYEQQLSTLTTKMGGLETLLVQQRQKSQQLEHEL